MKTEEEYNMRIKRKPRSKLIKERKDGKTVTVFNPHCDFSSGMFTTIMSIKLSKEFTQVEIKGSCKDSVVEGNCLQIDGEVSEKKYRLLKTIGVPFKPSFKNFKKGQKVFYFTLIFEPLPYYEKQINIKETSKSIWIGPDFCFTDVGLWKKNHQYTLKDYSKS